MSKLRVSVRFANLLKAMGGNKIAREILNNVNIEIELLNNFIDITNSKDVLSFTPDRKAIELMKNIPSHFIVHTHGNLLFKNSNKKIFDILEFDMNSSTAFQIPTGTIGDIIKEYISEVSGKTYCLFKENESDRLGVINKDSLRPHNNIFYKYISSDQYYDDDLGSISPWFNAVDVHVDTINTSRNNIKIGRLIRTLIKSEVIDSDIEDFVNSYKSTYDVLSNAFNKFSIVEGEDIIHWYNKKNYLEGGGTLNSSCMAEVAKTYFNIYVKNSNVKMVVLYDDDGKVSDDVYKSKKIKGRAILWSCEIDDEQKTFMDRVYTRFDSDINLFKEFAKNNGWWFKDCQDMETNGYITDGTQRKRTTIKVKLDKSKTGKLPYMDTLCYIDSKNNFCTNNSNLCDNDHIRTARTTHGGWHEND